MGAKVGVLGVCIAINIKSLTKGHIGRLARYRPLFVDIKKRELTVDVASK